MKVEPIAITTGAVIGTTASNPTIHGPAIVRFGERRRYAAVLTHSPTRSVRDCVSRLATTTTDQRSACSSFPRPPLRPTRTSKMLAPSIISGQQLGVERILAASTGTGVTILTLMPVNASKKTANEIKTERTTTVLASVVR